MADKTKPSDLTRAEEAREAGKGHDAGREATASEGTAADRNDVDPEAREAYKEMTERGAHQKGEGKPGV